MPSISTFYADAVLFDMDGTLTDSIAAVEAAWGKVATDLGLDPEYVIAATHGKRAVDNLKQFKPHIQDHNMVEEVETFEQSILFYADAYRRHGPGSQIEAESFVPNPSPPSANSVTPELSPGSSAPSSRRGSKSRRPSLGYRLSEMLRSIRSSPLVNEVDDPFIEEESQLPITKDVVKDVANAVLAEWQLEATTVNRAVRILPDVKRMLSSIPEGRYAVATSGAKTYAYGCMERVGIVPPPVTITADDKRLKAGKPAPDPFLLAAECLGFSASNCVVFEDSPSGIQAGVASGATVIAVCTSHEREKIENYGAHYIVDTMEQVTCEAIGTGTETKLMFTILP